MLPFIERFFGGGKSIHRRRLGGSALSPRCCRSSSNYRGWQVEARRQKHASLATTRFAAPSLRQPQHEEPSTKKPKPLKVSAFNQLYRISCWNQFEFTHFHLQFCANRCLMMNAWWSWRESPGLLCWWKLDLGPPSILITCLPWVIRHCQYFLHYPLPQSEKTQINQSLLQ